VLVRTRGWGSSKGESRSANDGRSWLLIKHKDEWAGDVDITEFAPKSVKSEGDLEDILAADNPDIWQTNRPAEGGATGAMMKAIIEKAAGIKAARTKTAARKTTKKVAKKPVRKKAAPKVKKR
jgi:hypothetical protein